MGGKKNFDISAKDFRIPLLASLGSLTGLEANKPVAFKDTWGPVCTALGISMSDYGEVEPGKTWVQQWIGWAFRTLRNEGLGEMASKGQWMLTEAGVKEAQWMPLPVATPDIDKAPEPIPAAQEVDTMTVEAKPAIPGVSLAVSMGNNVSVYHPDPYIRALAANKTKCFGLYTPRATKTCNTCGLAGACQNMTAMSMAILATTMGLEDAAAEAAAVAAKAAPPVPVKSAAPVAAPAPAPVAAPVAAGFDNTSAEPIMAHVRSTCYRCGKPIETGANCYWLRPSGGKKGGLFHQECF